MKIEIKNRFNGEIILCGEYDSIKNCIEKNSEANLSGANLSGADLREADLSGADMGAIIFISGSKHTIQFNKNYGELRIGCIVCHLEYWLIMYDTIGRENCYTDQQIEEYHKYMKALKMM